MSVNKFKVGDKVRVREGLVVDKFYGDMYCYPFMDKIGGEILTVDSVQNIYYGVKENACYWSDEMLEPIKKTLDNLCVGDVIEGAYGTRKVLGKADSCYLLSYQNNHSSACSWYTVADLSKYGYRPIDPDAPEPTIEIDGKKYKKADVEKAIKDLEVVDQIMYPGCQICGKPAKTINSEYCRGTYCDGKPMEYPSVKKPHTRKKLTRAMIKARRKKGRKKRL